MIVRPRRATWHINHERGIAAEAILPLPQTLEGGDHVFNRCDQFDLVGGERKGASKRGFCHRVRMERAEAGGCSATRMMAGHQSCRATAERDHHGAACSERVDLAGMEPADQRQRVAIPPLVEHLRLHQERV
jgi:hypothetical protein